MRKILALAIGLIIFLAISPAKATQLSHTYTIRNNTQSDATTSVSTATIIPGVHKILSFTVIPIPGSTAGAFASLYSGAGGMAVNQNLLGEAESIADASKDKIFPYPKAVRSGGLIVKQSCFTDVIIDYTR